MLVTLSGIVMLVRLGQLENTLSAMLVMLSGIVTLVRRLQLSKAPFPMLVTLLGIVILFRPVQCWKALIPILVMILGIVTVVRLLQALNTPSSMVVTLLPIGMFVKLLQTLNAPLWMVVTLFGIATLFRLRQRENALIPMFVTLLPIVTLAKAAAGIERKVPDTGDAVRNRDARKAPYTKKRVLPYADHRPAIDHAGDAHRATGSRVTGDGDLVIAGRVGKLGLSCQWKAEQNQQAEQGSHKAKSHGSIHSLKSTFSRRLITWDETKQVARVWQDFEFEISGFEIRG